MPLIPYPGCDLVLSAWGLTAIDAYLAYNDTTMLKFAQEMWVQTSAYQLTDSDVQRGFSAKQNATIPAICNYGEDIWFVCGGSITLIFDSYLSWSATTAGAVFAVSLHNTEQPDPI